MFIRLLQRWSGMRSADPVEEIVHRLILKLIADLSAAARAFDPALLAQYPEGL